MAHHFQVLARARVFSARERFKILFKKVRIVLLFMYMLRRVKFYGLHILRNDIKKEMEKLEKMKLVNFHSHMTNFKKLKTIHLYENKEIKNLASSEIKHEPIPLPKKKKIKKTFNKFCYKFLIHPEKTFMSYWNLVLSLINYILCYSNAL